MELSSKQRAVLRGLANGENTLFQIGKEGLGKDLLDQADRALQKRELIKLRVLETAPVNAKEAAAAIAEAVGAAVVQVIGSRLVLYRPNKKNPVIKI